MNEGQSVQQLETGIETLKMTAIFPQFTADTLFRYWVEPELLKAWWVPEAAVEPQVGGSYHFQWRSANRDLRGHFTAFEPGEHLAYTWNWDHEPELAERTVDLRFEPAPSDGTLLTVTHNAYTDSAEDQADRDSHIAGWTYYLGQLQRLQPSL